MYNKIGYSVNRVLMLNNKTLNYRVVMGSLA